jgi:Helix-turn-helix domain
VQPQSSSLPPKRARTIPRGRLLFAETQRDEILRLLREAGTAGVSRAELIFKRRMTQCGVRIDELKHAGFAIRSEERENELYVRYVLDGEPPEPKPLPGDTDWYRHFVGKPWPRETDNLPLFGDMRR